MMGMFRLSTRFICIQDCRFGCTLREGRIPTQQSQEPGLEELPNHIDSKALLLKHKRGERCTPREEGSIEQWLSVLLCAAALQVLRKRDRK
eukprot:628455-Amphidinium_carterae.1